MATWCEKVDVENLHDETFDILCSLCKSKDRNKEAAKYCVDCHDYYCSKCVKFHEDIPALLKHKILEKGQFQPISKQEITMAPRERCEKHSHNHVDMYCQNHDIVGCPTCMATDHRLCNAIFYIPEFLKTTRYVPNTRDTQKMLEASQEKLQQHHSRVESQKNRKVINKTKLLQKVKTAKENLIARIDVLEQCSIKEIEDKYEPVLTMIQDELDNVQPTTDLLLSAVNNLASASENTSQDFVNIKKSENIARTVEDSIASSKATEQVEHLNFEAEEILFAMLKQMNSLGKVCKLVLASENTAIKDTTKSEKMATHGTAVANNDSTDKSQAKLTEGKTKSTTKSKEIAEKSTIKSQAMAGEVGQKPKLQKKLDRKLKWHGCNVTYKVKGRKTCNVKIPSDERNCSIRSVCLLENGTVILADYNNKKLKHAEIKTCTVIEYCNLVYEPWQVCSINKQEVAVSCWQYGIQFISLQTKMITTRQMHTDHTCDGLAYAVGRLYISDRSSIYIYNMSGRKLRKFERDQSEQRWYSSYFKPALFSWIYSLAVSDDGLKIYVADGDKGLIVLDHTGKVTGKFNGPKLQCAGNVCITENGSVLVTELVNRNILQFGPHCELIGEVLKTDKEDKKPVAVCFDHTSSKITVTHKDQNDIEEYDLM